eukprot:420227_1
MGNLKSKRKKHKEKGRNDCNKPLKWSLCSPNAIDNILSNWNRNITINMPEEIKDAIIQYILIVHSISRLDSESNIDDHAMHILPDCSMIFVNWKSTKGMKFISRYLWNKEYEDTYDPTDDGFYDSSLENKQRVKYVINENKIITLQLYDQRYGMSCYSGWKIEQWYKISMIIFLLPKNDQYILTEIKNTLAKLKNESNQNQLLIICESNNDINNNEISNGRIETLFDFADNGGAVIDMDQQSTINNFVEKYLYKYLLLEYGHSKMCQEHELASL